MGPQREDTSVENVTHPSKPLALADCVWGCGGASECVAKPFALVDSHKLQKRKQKSFSSVNVRAVRYKSSKECTKRRGKKLSGMSAPKWRAVYIHWSGVF